MVISGKKLLICIAIPLLTGLLAALLTRDSMAAFDTLVKPPLSPPGWLFPVVWTILYILMGIASYLVLTSRKNNLQIRRALSLYALQLLFNFFWPILFFRMQRYLFAFFWLLLLELLILLTTLRFSRISDTAAKLMIPYLIWVAFAGYLNLGIALLNG